LEGAKGSHGEAVGCDAGPAEQQRYGKRYSPTEEVRENSRDGVTSEYAKAVQHKLKELDLPTLNDVKDEFERLCKSSGSAVGGEEAEEHVPGKIFDCRAGGKYYAGERASARPIRTV
jgi:hypothetical protein